MSATVNVAPRIPRPLPNWVQVSQFIVGLAGLLLSLWLAAPKLPVLHIPTEHKAQAPNEHLFVLHLTQAVVILVVILIQHWQLRDLEPRVSGGDIAQRTFTQFRMSWLSMWIVWLILYAWLSVRVGWGPSNWLDWVTDVLDVLSSFAVWVCFAVLDQPSISTTGNPDRDLPFRRAVRVAALAAFVCVVLALIDRLFGVGHLGLASVGLYSGLALACFTGRVGSHYINMPRWMLLFLYLYAMLQLFYSFFDTIPAQWTWGIFTAVLILKIMLAFAGIDMLRYGGLNNYLAVAEGSVATSE